MIVWQFCKPFEEQVYNLIVEHGPISGQDLADKVGHKTDRAVRRAIKHLRVDHHLPICATPGESFFWPRKFSDGHHCINSLHSRIQEIKLTADSIEDGLEELFGDQPLFVFEEAV